MSRWLMVLVLCVGACAPAKAAQAPKWPEAKAPDTSDPYWQTNNNLSINSTPYLKVEIAPGYWEWRVNLEAENSAQKADQKRRLLWAALTSRVLSDEELRQVAHYGRWLNVDFGVSYNAGEKLTELSNALLIQSMLRQTRKAPPNDQC